jgi:Anthranilate/para-aminobenzoate synthases component I
MSTPLVEELIPAPDPVESCARFRGLPYLLFLDSARDHSLLGRYSFLAADPALVVHGKGAHAFVLDTRTGADTPLDSHALAGVRELLAPHLTEPLSGLPPFQGGAAGYLAYDWGAVLERLPVPRYDDLAIPDVVFPIYDWVIAWDHLERRAWIISTGLPATGPEKSQRCEDRLTLVRGRLSSNSLSTEAYALPAPATLPRVEHAPSYPVSDTEIPASLDLRSSFTHRGYLDALTRVREYIIAGDIFQANLSQRFEAPLTESPFALYQRLRAVNPAPFAAFLEFGDVTVASASPERFLRLDTSRQVEARPIKGTRPRGVYPAHDAALGRALQESVKDRAENLMIVDLMRNDLSRVSLPGSVRVPELFALERTPPCTTSCHGYRRARARPRCNRPPLRHLPRRVDHRRPEGSRDGDHSRARALATWRLLRLDWLRQRHGRHGYEHRHPHLSGSPRADILFRRRWHRRRFRPRAGVPRDLRQGPRAHSSSDRLIGSRIRPHQQVRPA